MKKILIVCVVLVTVLLSGCAKDIPEVDAEIIHMGLTKLTYDGTIYACHEMRHGQDLNMMCRKVVSRKRQNTIPQD